MGGWDLSTCNNVKIITQGRDVWRYPACTPIQPAPFQCVLVNERGVTETGAHLNDTSYWAFVGIQETPLRIPGFCLSTAYHTWLGKASRSQTLNERLPTKSDPVCLWAFGNVSVLQSGCSIFIFMPLFFFHFFPFLCAYAGCHNGQFCLYCSVSCQHALNELATLLAMPFLIYFLL